MRPRLFVRKGYQSPPRARAPEILEVADACFSLREIGELDALLGAARARRAVQLWTTKEAYIKCVGKGLSMPLREFGVVF